MNTLDFLIIYEHKARELNSVCLLRAELELRGYSVDIVQVNQSNMFRFKTIKKPKVIVTFALYDNVSFMAHVVSIAGNCKKVVNLQWEQIFASAEKDIAFHTPKETAVLATHICWGKESYDRLKTHGVKNAVITGAIHMDFLKKDLEGYYMKREEIEQKYQLPTGKMLLYISSFVIAALIDKEKEILRDKLADVDEREKNAVESKEKTLEIFRRILDLNDGTYIIYRPHPGENIDGKLLEMEKQYPLFRIISEESVQQWIVIADHIISWTSTAIAEAFYAKRNCIILRPLSLPSNWDSILYTNAKTIASYEELKEHLSTLEHDFPISEEVITSYYGNTEYSLAYINIANLLERVRNTTEYDIVDVRKKIYLKYSIKRTIKALIWKLNINNRTWPFSKVRFIREQLAFMEYYKQKIEVELASKEEIDAITEKIKNILKVNHL